MIDIWYLIGLFNIPHIHPVTHSVTQTMFERNDLCFISLNLFFTTFDPQQTGSMTSLQQEVPRVWLLGCSDGGCLKTEKRNLKMALTLSN